MPALEHQLAKDQLEISIRRGIENRILADPGADYTFLGNYVPDPSLDPQSSTSGEDYPVILPKAFGKNHMWLLGATRGGKSARTATPIAAQKIRQNLGPVVIGDMKLDDAMFHSLKNVAEEEGRRFLWFTNVPYFSTYLFNPWDNFRHVTFSQLVQSCLNCWNLWFGFDYGRLFYSAQSRGALARALKFVPGKNVDAQGRRRWLQSAESKRITSFQEAYDRVKAIAGHPEYGGAHGLLMVLEDMANILQLGFAHDGKPLPKTAIDNAINVADMLMKDKNGKYPVVYFGLRGINEMVGVSQVMKMLLTTLLTAQIQARDFYKMGRRAEQPPEEIWVLLDEFQLMADDAIRLTLAQSAGYGFSFCLANQDLSQLRQGKIDLVETIWENCGSKCFWTARDVDLQDRIIKMSGERTIHVASYDVSHEAFRAGLVEEEFALQVINGDFKGITIQETRGPRLDRNALIELSNHPSRMLYVPPQGASGVDFGGYPIVVDCPFHITETEFDELSRKPWPAPTPETIVPEQLLNEATESQGDWKPQEPTKRVSASKPASSRPRKK